jgi:hypothetical protein
LWSLTAVVGFVGAQSKGQSDARAASGDVLTDELLMQDLTNMGFEPKKLSKGFLIAIKQDTWTLNMQLVISANGEKIGLNANLGKVDDPASVSAPTWYDLLVSNGDIDPAAFYFDKDQKKLYLHRTFDNRGVTPAILRREIEAFGGAIRKTENLWKFTK